CLEGTRIDLKQEFALADNRAFFEMHALQVAGNTRANLDHVDCFKSAGELVTVSYLLANNFRYTHFRRRWSLGLSRTGTSGVQAGKSREADGQHQPRPNGAVVLTLPWVRCFQLHVCLPVRFLRFPFRFRRLM